MEDGNADQPEDTSKASKWGSPSSTKRHSRNRAHESPKIGRAISTSVDTPLELPRPELRDIFASDELPAGCVPLFISQPTQQMFNILADDQVTREKPWTFIGKSELVKDLHARAAVSDFSVQKAGINDYQGTEILLFYDADLKFGENFVICLSEDSKQFLMQPSEHDSNEETEATDDDTDHMLEEASDSVTVYNPKIRRPWISLGSEKEIMDSLSLETRSKVYTIYSRPRREFESPLVLSNRNATDKGASSMVVSVTDKSTEITINELDKAVTNAQMTSEQGTNTDWKFPRNAFTQCYPRTFNNEELQSFYAQNGPLQDISNHLNAVEQGLSQNMMYDFLANDFENLAAGDETYDTRADNTFKEFLSFTDLKFSKDKAVTNIQWHPTIKGIVAMSVGERQNYDHRCDHASRIILTSTHIILWSFADPIQPQLLLEAPDDIMCFQFSPTDPSIVAGGCFNGMVVLWDIEKHMEDLKTVKARMKAKKTQLFSFDYTDPNRVAVSPYCAVSNIESSHTSPILDLQWVPDHMEINRLGYCMENLTGKCVQLISCGLNNELLFWDTRPDKSPLAVDKSRDAIKPPRNVPTTFLPLDMKWKPMLRVHLFKTEAGGDHSPTKFCMREVQGDRRLLEANADDKNPVKSVTVKQKPLNKASTMLYVGTEDGDLVYIDWMPQKDQDTGKMQTPKPDFYATQHDGPISYVARSPFEPSILLVVGGYTWSMWKEGVNSGPILESGHALKPLTGGCWSPTRPSVFYICRADGSLEVWDLLDKTHEPAMIQSVSANALTALSLCNFSRRQIIAIGDVQGALQLFLVPRRLKSMLAQELSNFNVYIDREVKRREFVLMRWSLREQEKIEHETEKKRLAGVAPAVELTDDERTQKEALEYGEYLKSEQTFLRQLGLLVEDDIL